jgi:hypothetical protein
MISTVGPVAHHLLMQRVMMMRSVLALSLFATACTSPSPSGGETYASVRDRLSDGSTRLFMGGAESTGVVTARRWTSGGWIAGDTPLVIEGGELSASVDASGAITLASFEVGVASIEIPEEVFKKPAQLSDVRIKLTAPASGAATWSDDDTATATLGMTLDLAWSITVNGGKTPLGTQHLPPIDVDVTLGGDGDHVEASVALAASGELWNWAGLLQLNHLELALAATTVD